MSQNTLEKTLQADRQETWVQGFIDDEVPTVGKRLRRNDSLPARERNV